MNDSELELTLEAALLAAGRPLDIDELTGLLEGADAVPDRARIRRALDALGERWAERAVELVEVAGGYRAQVRREFSGRLGRLWAERPARYSRALLETLALIAYRQPITRGEIEEVRGVAVGTSIVKTLLEREWVRVLGHREVPGRPALFGTTRTFLDDFGLASLQDLPPLSEIRDLSSIGDDLFATAGLDAVAPLAIEGDGGGGEGEGDPRDAEDDAEGAALGDGPDLGTDSGAAHGDGLDLGTGPDVAPGDDDDDLAIPSTPPDRD